MGEQRNFLGLITSSKDYDLPYKNYSFNIKWIKKYDLNQNTMFL